MWHSFLPHASALLFLLVFSFANPGFAQTEETPPSNTRSDDTVPMKSTSGSRKRIPASSESSSLGSGGDYVGTAWNLFNAKNYTKAVKLFKLAREIPATENEAKFGLAMCYSKQNDEARAIAILEELVQKKFKLDNVLPNLFFAVIKSGDHNRAKEIAGKIKGKQGIQLRKMVDELIVRNNFAQAQENGDLPELEKLIASHHKYYESCNMPELFFDAAGLFAIRGKREEALNIYRGLLHNCQTKWELRPAILYALKDMLPGDEMVPIITKELKRPLPEKYREEAMKFEINLYKGMIDVLDPSLPVVKKMADRILSVEPDDPFTRTVIAKWYYHNGDYKKSYQLFNHLNQQFITEKGDKLEGLLLSMVKLGRVEESIELLKQSDIEDKGTEKNILQGMHDAADESSQGFRILGEEILRIAPNNQQAISRLGWWHYHQGNYDMAYNFFLDIYKGKPDETSSLALIYTMLKLGKFDDALILFEAQRLDDIKLKIIIMKSKLFTLPPTSPHRRELVEAILELDPEDSSALSVYAWMIFQEGNYTKARDLFQKLHQREPKNSDYLSGLLTALAKSGEHEKALEIADGLKFDEEFNNKMRGDLYLNMGSYAFNAGDQEKAESYLEKSLTYNPENNGAHSLLMWTRFKLGKIDEALNMALADYNKSNDPEIAKNILLFYQKLGRPDDSDAFIESLFDKDDDAYKKIVADYYFSKKLAVKAAQAYSFEDTPYYNADKPWLEASYLHRMKTGSSGISRLTEDAYPVKFYYPLPEGQSISLQVNTVLLNADPITIDPPIGSDYLGIGQIREPVTKSNGIIPSVTYTSEGEISYMAQVGTTYIGGPISAVPTFQLNAKGNTWEINLHHEQMDNSILSFIGQRDPYSGKNWGRVLKTGAEIDLSLSPVPAAWLSMKGGYDYLWGHNVLGNRSVHGAAAIGTSISGEYFDFNLGYSTSKRLYDHSTGFYTFGHGGYFSPDIFYEYGPFISLNTKRYEKYWLKLSLSHSNYHFEADSVRKYPLNPQRTEIFSKSDKTDQGNNFSVEAYTLLGQRWVIGAFYSSNNTTGYREVEYGISLRYNLAHRTKYIPWER